MAAAERSAALLMRAMLGPRALPLGLCLLMLFQSVAPAGVWDGPGGGIAFVLAVDPSKPGTVYAGAARGGIFQSTNAGRTWRRLTRAPHPTRIKALAVDGAGRVYAGVGDGRVLESTDAGESWTRIASAPREENVESLAVDSRTSPETVYAGTAAGSIRRSVDGGRTWSGCGPGLPGLSILVLAIDRRPEVLWAGTVGGVFRSADGGGSWSSVHSVAARELVVDPTRPHTIFAVHEGVFRSTDDGATWRRLPGIRNALSLAIDPSTVPGAVYVGTSYDSVRKSTDGGDTWRPARTGLDPLGEVVELAIDTRTKPSTLYATSSHLGVRRSTDGGASWQADEGPSGHAGPLGDSRPDAAPHPTRASPSRPVHR